MKQEEKLLAHDILHNLALSIFCVYATYFFIAISVVLGLLGIHQNGLNLILCSIGAYCTDQYLLYLGEKYKSDIEWALHVVKSEDAP